ncbi:ABC transporter permease [Mesorhizobium sp. Cs1330R2N1]|uniref:ABC transporter permease n=1 Tax=Mesorhizobium argentiipisi TaxID=3015175 RepID=A0ABU8KJ71_9HYPH
MLSSRSLTFLGSLGFALVCVATWQAISTTKVVSPIYLPAPDTTFYALVDGFTKGALLSATLYTIARMLVGWMLACVAGIALGALIGSSAPARVYLSLTLETLRPLPTSALIPVFIAFFGLSEGMVLGAIAVGAVWPIMLSTMNGVTTVEPLLKDVAASLQMSRMEFVRKIALPGAMPEILAAARLCLTVSLVLAVVGEMLTGRSGLGQWLLMSARNFAGPNLFAGVVVLGLIGYLGSLSIAAIERNMLKDGGVHET